MGDVLSADARIEDVADIQLHLFFFALLAIMHQHLAIEHHKHFLAVVDVPFLRLICPVQARGDAVHAGDVQRAPGSLGGERLAADNLHLSIREKKAGQR